MHDVSFDSSGTRLAWVGHDSTVSVVNSANDNKIGLLRASQLPFLTCEWAGPNSLVVGVSIHVYQWYVVSYEACTVCQAKKSIFNLKLILDQGEHRIWMNL